MFSNYLKNRSGSRRTFLGRFAVLLGVFGAAAPGVAADAYADFFDAIRADDVSAVRLQLLRGISPNSPDPKLGPALPYALSQKAFAVASVLVEYPGTNLNVRNATGETPLMLAALAGETTLAAKMIARGAEVNKPGWAPLHYAAGAGHLPMIELLLEQNAYIDAASENGTTPLMFAARENKPEAVRLLVERGADPSLRNDAGLGAADYLKRAGAEADAAWVRERADAYLRRFGTKEAPVPAPPRAPGR